jgi:hypothetical protein
MAEGRRSRGGGTAAPRRPATAGGGDVNKLHLRKDLGPMSILFFFAGDRINP